MSPKGELDGGCLLRLPWRITGGWRWVGRPDPVDPAKGPGGRQLGVGAGVARRHWVLARGQPEPPGEVLGDGPAEAAERAAEWPRRRPRQRPQEVEAAEDVADEGAESAPTSDASPSSPSSASHCGPVFY